jgi:hypothetical protein
MTIRVANALVCLTVLIAVTGCCCHEHKKHHVPIPCEYQGVTGYDPPVVAITPPPAAPPNPVVLGVNVSKTDGYAYVDSSTEYGASRLTVSAFDSGGGQVGTPATENLSCTSWGDGNHTITLSSAQRALINDSRTKKVIFDILVNARKDSSFVKCEDSEEYRLP